MEIKYIGINQTRLLLTIGKTNGYIIISIENNKVLNEKYTLGAINIVELYYSTNILFIVGDNKELNTLNIWDAKLEKYVGFIKNKNYIEKIKINRDYIIIYDNYDINIYTFKNLELIKSIKCNNIYFDLSINVNNLIICSNTGYIKVYNLDNNNCEIFKAHDSSIQYLKISRTNKYIASVSEYGRKIKIFDLYTTKLKKILYRGVLTSKIINIEFDEIDNYILLYSNTGTIHIYNILEDNPKTLISNISNYMFNYEINNYEYSLYRIELNKINNICIMNNYKKINIVNKDTLDITRYKLENINDTLKYLKC